MTTIRKQGAPWLIAAGALLVALGLVGLASVYLSDLEYLVGTIAESSPLPPLATVEATAAAVDAFDGAAHVSLPRLGIDVRVSDGDDQLRDRALATGAWWHAGTAPPGADGNTVLAGHRVRRVFAKLAYVRVGDEVIVNWGGTPRSYRVARTFTVTPDDTSILDQDGEERLTLYTCIPRAFGNKRRVVVATPVR